MAESLCTIHSLEEYRKRKEEEKRRELDQLIMDRAAHIPLVSRKPRGFGTWTSGLEHPNKEQNHSPVQSPSLFSALINKFFDMCEGDKDEE